MSDGKGGPSNRAAQPPFGAEVEPPRRQTNPTHNCLCRLTDEHGKVRDSCSMNGVDADSPLCRDCVQAGHADLPHLPYPTVARRQQEAR